MSAQIIAFPGARIPDCAIREHDPLVLAAALRVERLALRIHAEYDDRSRIIALDRGVKLLPGGRQELHDFIAVFDADPYTLAIRGAYLNDQQWRSIEQRDDRRKRADPR